VDTVLPQSFLQEYMAAGEKLKEASGKKDFSGIYFPGQDWRNALPYIWSAGGDLAVQKDGKWQGSLSTPVARCWPPGWSGLAARTTTCS